ncbi:hypothetical protein BHF71_02510 [Vulcanibacillus modesticaldus]|uniref:Putative Flagellin Flp1-like domain-containing protein n=1 Tax=Vulcanibacillus modesticaldus TaxID=337097 RepID=A0A1D2YTQ2_9BACI|nr:Flp1 family type IVb pilin [Vulcanibacillus modesticaldus]OEF99074.1 hypothetical protein BHF71_02510 [Vulcanibacillus modesticaldus]
MTLLKYWIYRFWSKEEGLGTLEILLIVTVLVGVALLFRGKIFDWVETLLNKSDSNISNF